MAVKTGDSFGTEQKYLHADLKSHTGTSHRGEIEEMFKDIYLISVTNDYKCDFTSTEFAILMSYT